MTRLVSALYDDFYPFHKLGFIEQFAVISDPKNLTPEDILIVWGGADISPSLYKRQVSRYTGANDVPSKRDSIEWALMQRAKELGCPIIGVCRGAQMLCALAGGYLIQHVESHSGSHEVSTCDGGTIITNSIHHQMMAPWGVPHEMLASIKEKLSTVHYDVDVDVTTNIVEEPEFVYFPEVKGFAIQWHPEMMKEECAATTFVLSKIKEKLHG